MPSIPTKIIPDHAECLRHARHAALEAWRRIAHYHRGVFDVFEKIDGPATDADRLADRVIVETLERHHPRATTGYLTEESTDSRTRLRLDRVWIIDPIDGTSDFMKGQKDFVVHIALVEFSPADYRFRPVVSVVYHPFGRAMYSAIAGRGAWVEYERREPEEVHWWEAGLPSNDETIFEEPQRLRVGDEAVLERMHAVSTKSHPSKRLEAALRQLSPSRVSHMGSLGLKLVQIAAGRADYYINTSRGRVKEWDLCAPHLIVEEAGGRVTDLRGDPVFYNLGDVALHWGVVASNGASHSEMVRQLARVPDLLD